ncbi:chemotaxis protein CheW [Sulfuricaulis limicola]|uniref:Chemotaxis protein CheW n=1 Tax=Sulfuricaulis limicola TaxID=1620215 RepID=A0A1B4XG75_9GAMM|nr:chemotaxis protein CheW [Sulfuricaulis limicola]BAV33789.1 chemotaxis protein CheW [Sulfuricaulis limicola]
MQAARAMEQKETTSGEEQFLTFRLHGQDYGIGILKIQEIKGWDKVTPIPNSPAYVKGVLNLRGVIVPVIDLRLRFGLPEAERDIFTVIIVANVNGRLAGIVVDAVSDVINVGAAHLCEAPEYEGQENREFIKGLAQVDGKLLVLLDVDRLVNPDSLDKSASAAPVAAAR